MTGDIKWNFTKFLVDRNGTVIQRFEPEVTPDSKEVTEAIEPTLEGFRGTRQRTQQSRSLTCCLVRSEDQRRESDNRAQAWSVDRKNEER